MGIIWGIIIIVLVFSFGIIGVVINLLKEIFMPRRMQQKKQETRAKNHDYYRSQKGKKLIDKNEGEYVDFEEMT